jgi:hypothetical protein
MVDPTLSETLAAWLGLIVIVATFILIIIGISVRAMRIGRRLTTPPTLNAEIDARILMTDNLHVHGDPSYPVQEYAAVNETRELLKKRRR